MVWVEETELPKVLSVNTAVPEKNVALDGVKLKLSPQLAPGANGKAAEQSGVRVSAKLVPSVRAREPANGWFPMFCTATDGPTVLVLPTFVRGKENDGGWERFTFKTCPEP
jgi:hypothetical protein